MENASVESRDQLPAVAQPAIPAEVARDLPEAVRARVAALPPDQQAAFLRDYESKSASLAKAYLFSLIYCHYILLGRWSMTGFMLLSLFIAATLGSVWWIIDLFRMPFLVRHHNAEVAAELLRKIGGAAADPADLAPC